MTNSGNLRRGTFFVPAPRLSLAPVEHGRQARVHGLEFLEQIVPSLRRDIAEWASTHCTVNGDRSIPSQLSTYDCTCEIHLGARSCLSALKKIVAGVSQFVLGSLGSDHDRQALADDLLDQYRTFLDNFWKIGFRYARGDSLTVSLVHRLGQELNEMGTVLRDSEIPVDGQLVGY